MSATAAMVRTRRTRNDVRDFALLALFVGAFLAASYLALWKPLLAPWLG